MRHLVDLGSKIAIIEWYDKHVFPSDKKQRYMDLFMTVCRWKNATKEEIAEFDELKNIEGDVGVRIDSVQITDMALIKADVIRTTFAITGHELHKINSAIDELKEKCKGQKVLMQEVVTIDGWL